MTQIDIQGADLRVIFNRWDRQSYDLFLRTKALPEHAVVYDEQADTYTIEAPARFARLLGIPATSLPSPWAPMAAHLRDYQRFITRTALEAKRYAVWADTGTGKTAIELEWLRQVLHATGGKVLQVAPINLIPQFQEMAGDFYGGDYPPIVVLGSREELIAWCRDGRQGIGFTNPEKFIPRGGQEVIPEITHCAGVSIDESSLLKTGGGKIKWALIKSCRGVEYKLSNTATPAPNDPLEYASQASWLEKIRDEGEVIWTFFTRDSDGEWKVKDHALEAFYRFLSGWSCYLRDPRRYGFADNLQPVPSPVRLEHRIPATDEQLAYLAKIPNAEGQCSLVEPTALGITERTRLGQLASGFLYSLDGRREPRRIASLKPQFIADLVRQEVAAGLQVIVWTLYDETVRILSELLPDVAHEAVIGAVPLDQRPGIVARFKAGALPVILTRARMMGFGFNLQACGSMVFADFNDSAEQIYQAERRACRYGQQRSVRIHFPYVHELQGVVWSNVEAKRIRMARDVETMEGLYVEAMRPFLEGAK